MAVPASVSFTRYQKFVVALLAFLQFTVILDFMVLAPLGAVLMPELHIGPSQFGLVVSAYALSAAAAGIVAAGFADRFDRKRLLLFFYAGFLAGTMLCGFAPTYPLLLGARVATGLFGGVMGSIVNAIAADLFPPQSRGRVTGTIQSAFGASQVLGIPFGLFLASHFGWHMPFRLIAGVGLSVGLVIVAGLAPITGHLEAAAGRRPFEHLMRTATDRRHLVGFFATMLVATGGFMLQPFASAFAVNNLGVPVGRLPMIYVAAGTVGMLMGPWLGRTADAIGKLRMFAFGTAVGCAWIVWYTRLGPTPIWVVLVANAVLALAIGARMASTMALIMGVPAPKDRGAYMAVSSSMQQLAGGVAAWAAGLLVVQDASGRIVNYPTLGWVVVATMVLTLVQMRRVDRMVSAPATPPPATVAADGAV
jgi:predicted MFS family arabinose efflux permease